MKIAALLSLSAAFALGACASTVARHAGTGTAHAALAPTVIPLEQAPRAQAPSGKAEVAHLARGDNAYVGRLEMAAGAAVPEHRDATEEYIHVLEGAGTMHIDGQRYEIAAGTTVFMPANALVRFQNGAAKMVALQVFAGPAPASKYARWSPIERTP